MIQQQETHQRMQSQPMLTPKAVPHQSLKSQPKDLTATLLKNNLDELNLSMSRSTMSQSTVKNIAHKYNNISLTQSQFLTSPTLNSQSMSNRPMNWNSNGMSTPMNWNSPQSLVWNSIAPQNNVNFATQPEIKPNLNFPGTLQPLTSSINTQTNALINKSNSSTQDIMDLLS